MQTVKNILGDLEQINKKTDLYIDDVEKLIKRLEGLMAEWQKFAQENEERNRLLAELKAALEALKNFEILKSKHGESVEKSKGIRDVFNAQKDNQDYLSKQKAIDKVIEELGKTDVKLKEVQNDIGALAPQVASLKEI